MDILRIGGHGSKVPGRDMARAPKGPAKDPAQRRESVKRSHLQTQMAAPASKKAPPSATRTSPGQFDLMPKPLPSLSGSRLACRLAGGSRDFEGTPWKPPDAVARRMSAADYALR